MYVRKNRRGRAAGEVVPRLVSRTHVRESEMPHHVPLLCPASNRSNWSSTIFAFVANVVLVQSIRLWSLNPPNLLLFLSSLGLQSKT